MFLQNFCLYVSRKNWFDPTVRGTHAHTHPHTRSFPFSPQNMLSLLAPSFVGLESSKRSLLEAIIMQNAERPESPSRLMALKFATLIFPRDHMASRFVLLLCSGDPREEVRGEALKALRSRPSSDHTSIN